MFFPMFFPISYFSSEGGRVDDTTSVDIEEEVPLLSIFEEHIEIPTRHI